jgi:hypothetical protein
MAAAAMTTSASPVIARRSETTGPTADLRTQGDCNPGTEGQGSPGLPFGDRPSALRRAQGPRVRGVPGMHGRGQDVDTSAAAQN